MNCVLALRYAREAIAAGAARAKGAVPRQNDILQARIPVGIFTWHGRSHSRFHSMNTPLYTTNYAILRVRELERKY